MQINMDTLVLTSLLLASFLVGVLSEKRCYVCSGKFPDRDCELYPQYVTMGPGKLNCTMKYCTVIARYKPKKYLLTLSKDKKLTSTARPLTTMDFEVDSIARECEDLGRGNSCETDPDDLGITCYSMCTDDLCNKGVPKPKDYIPKQKRPSSKEDDASFPDKEVEKSKEDRKPELPPLPNDYDSPNEINSDFPKPLMNDTTNDTLPSTTEENEMPPPGKGPGRRPNGRNPPQYNNIGDYEGQADNGAAICTHYHALMLTAFSILYFLK